MSEKEKRKLIEGIKEKLRNNKINKKDIEDELRQTLANKFRIQKGIEEAVKNEKNDFGWCHTVVMFFNEPLWQGIEEIKKLDNQIDILVRTLKELEKGEEID